MFSYLLYVAYDGTDFCGFAKQKNNKAIQNKIDLSLYKVFKNDNFKTVGASKTDAGVHAIDQRIQLTTSFEFNQKLVIRSLNSKLPSGIKILKIKKIKNDFHIRNCKEKCYLYRIWKTEVLPFEERYGYNSNWNIDYDKLKESLLLFQGEHNFKNFCGLKKDELDDKMTIRKIKEIKFKISKKEFLIFFISKGFIRYQIRMIVGTCLAYAQNKIDLNNVIDLLETKNEKTKFIAEPRGLFLYKIKY